MRKKGFTLIELLAVIIILAVIALISTPIVLNVVDNAKKQANKNSAYGLLDAARLYYAESLLDSSKTGIDGTTNLLNEIKVSGDRPDSGNLYIRSTGQIALAVIYDDVCFIKLFNENDIKELDNNDECKIAEAEVYTPTNPNIIVSNYNVFYEDGIARVKINFDSKEGVKNYYSVDNGVT